jgi:hypothetical protein
MLDQLLPVLRQFSNFSRRMSIRIQRMAPSIVPFRYGPETRNNHVTLLASAACTGGWTTIVPATVLEDTVQLVPRFAVATFFVQGQGST